jgi:hypothetical protein
MEQATKTLTLESHDTHLLVVAQKVVSAEKKIDELTHRMNVLVDLCELLQYQVSTILDSLEYK